MPIIREIKLPSAVDKIITVELPIGAKIVEFGMRARESKIALASTSRPGPPGGDPGQKMMMLEPVLVVMADEDKKSVPRRFMLVFNEQPFPGPAQYLRNVGLPPAGELLHLIELL